MTQESVREIMLPVRFIIPDGDFEARLRARAIEVDTHNLGEPQEHYSLAQALAAVFLDGGTKALIVLDTPRRGLGWHLDVAFDELPADET